MVCLAILSGEKNLRIKQQNEYKPIWQNMWNINTIINKLFNYNINGQHLL